MARIVVLPKTGKTITHVITATRGFRSGEGEGGGGFRLSASERAVGCGLSMILDL